MLSRTHVAHVKGFLTGVDQSGPCDLGMIADWRAFPLEPGVSGCGQRNIFQVQEAFYLHTHAHTRTYAHTPQSVCLKSKVHSCHRLLIKRLELCSGSQPRRVIESPWRPLPPSPTRFLSNEVLLSGGLSRLVRLQLVIKLYSSVDIWIKPPQSRDTLAGSPNYTCAVFAAGE